MSTLFFGKTVCAARFGTWKPKSHAESFQDLITDPLALACVNLEGREEPSPDGHDAGTDKHEWRVVSDLLMYPGRRLCELFWFLSTIYSLLSIDESTPQCHLSLPICGVLREVEIPAGETQVGSNSILFPGFRRNGL